MLAATLLAIFFVPLFFVVVLGGLHIKPKPHESNIVDDGPT
jgi:hypothetical protein